MTHTTNLPTPKRVLSISAHPDDSELRAGGTLAKWAAAGAVVNVLVCTDGSKGTWERADDTAQLVATRQVEQRAAAKALGATGDVVFLGWPDGELDSGLRQRWEIAYWIRKLRPDVILGHDPWRRYRLHPDHRHAGFLTCDAIVAAREPHIFPEQEIEHWRPDLLLLFEADEPDHVEDVTGFGETKLASIEAHVSQYRSTMGIDDQHDDEQRRAFRKIVLDELEHVGASAGFGMAENFKRVDEV